MDAVDRKLLMTLRDNARMTYAELARALQMSAPAVHDRVARLEQHGVIRGYRADIAQEMLGLTTVALSGIRLSDAADQDEVAESLKKFTEIEDCWLVAGDDAFVVKIRVADMHDLELTLGRLRRTPGVAQIRTNVVLSERWRDRHADY